MKSFVQFLDESNQQNIVVENQTAIRNILDALGVAPEESSRYATLIVNDHKSKKLSDERLKSRLQDLMNDSKKIIKAMSMIKDEL